MARDMAFSVLVILAPGMVLLPCEAAAQPPVLSNGTAPDSGKPGMLPAGKHPPDERPGLPLSFSAGIEAVDNSHFSSQTRGTYTEITGGT